MTGSDSSLLGLLSECLGHILIDLDLIAPPSELRDYVYCNESIWVVSRVVSIPELGRFLVTCKLVRNRINALSIVTSV